MELFRGLMYAVQECNFLKFAEICVAILDDRLFFCIFFFYCNIYEMKPDIFEILRTFSRYLEKNSGISGNIFRRFFVIFVSRPMSEGFCSLNSSPHS